MSEQKELPIWFEYLKPTVEIAAEDINQKYPDFQIRVKSIRDSRSCEENVLGAMAAEEMARLMNYEGAVHLFAGSPASTSNVDRLKGFEDYMAANCPKIKVLGTLYSEADINLCTTQTVDVLSANPDLKAIFAVDEVRTSGCGTALIQQGRGDDIILGGFDANNDTVALMEEGVVNFLTVQQPFQMGYLAFGAALETLKGNQPEHSIVDTGCTVVLRENMNEEEMQKLLFPLNYIK